MPSWRRSHELRDPLGQRFAHVAPTFAQLALTNALARSVAAPSTLTPGVPSLSSSHLVLMSRKDRRQSARGRSMSAEFKGRMWKCSYTFPDDLIRASRSTLIRALRALNGRRNHARALSGLRAVRGQRRRSPAQASNAARSSDGQEHAAWRGFIDDAARHHLAMHASQSPAARLGFPRCGAAPPG